MRGARRNFFGLVCFRWDFRVYIVRLQKQASHTVANRFSGVIAIDLSQHTKIAIQALGNVLQDFSVDGWSLAFPCPDFLVTFIEACPSQIPSTHLSGMSALSSPAVLIIILSVIRSPLVWVNATPVLVLFSTGEDCVIGGKQLRLMHNTIYYRYLDKENDHTLIITYISGKMVIMLPPRLIMSSCALIGQYFSSLYFHLLVSEVFLLDKQLLFMSLFLWFYDIKFFGSFGHKNSICSTWFFYLWW